VPIKGCPGPFALQLLVKEGVSDPHRLRDCAFPIITNRDLANPSDRKKHDESLKTRIGGISSNAYDRIVATMRDKRRMVAPRAGAGSGQHGQAPALAGS